MIAAFHDHEDLTFEHDKMSAVVLELLENPGLGRIWLICQNSEKVGYLAATFGFSLEFGGRDAFLDELFIHESSRGKGLGKLAISAAVSEIAAIGIKAVHLEVSTANEMATRLYQSLGFELREQFNLMTKQI